jgi:fatty acid-binding protein DegV
MRVAVLHNDAREDAERLAERVRREHEPLELMIRIVSPVLGVHTGPRAVALCGYTA